MRWDLVHRERYKCFVTSFTEGELVYGPRYRYGCDHSGHGAHIHDCLDEPMGGVIDEQCLLLVGQMNVPEETDLH